MIVNVLQYFWINNNNFDPISLVISSDDSSFSSSSYMKIPFKTLNQITFLKTISLSPNNHMYVHLKSLE